MSETNVKINNKSRRVLFGDGNGACFDKYSIYMTKHPLPEVPKTYEAWIKLPEDLSEGAGALMGDKTMDKSTYLCFSIKENGMPQILYKNAPEKEAILAVDFDEVKLPTEKWVHIALTDDTENGVMKFYVDGVCAMVVHLTEEQMRFKRSIPVTPMGVGGDTRDGNWLWFKGELRSLVLFRNVRKDAEISADMEYVELDDNCIIGCYDMSNGGENGLFKDLSGEVDFINNLTDPVWLDCDSVEEPKDFDYSIAVVGDTQSLAYYYPESLHCIFDWLLENKEKYKIEHVFNTGDFTEKNLDREWILCREQFFRLNGKIDYTLVRGDHDVKNDKIDDNGDDRLKYDRFFGVDGYLSRFENGKGGVFRGEDGSITNSYRRVVIGGTDYLIITLDFRLSDEVISWVENILEYNDSEKIIFTTHRYLHTTGGKVAEGEIIWDRFASRYQNAELVICGHKIIRDVVWAKSVGIHGNVVNEVMVNPQNAGMDNHGPKGMICMLYFKKGSDKVQVRYYSTFLDKFFGEKNQYEVNLNDLMPPEVII